ncbi:MAG: lipid IV(A) 3-deoxy-D-manno-octulosonic acid transferase [Pseudomonadota bacterium]
MRHCYSACLYLLTPLILWRLLWRSRRAPDYARRLGERFGYCGFHQQQPSVWLHAVSMGEMRAALPLLHALRAGPWSERLVVTCSTPTASALLRQQFGDSLQHCYLPLDLPVAVTRALDRIRPHLLVLMETELWPNLVAHCARRDVPVVVVNARLSTRSARHYGYLPGLIQPMLRQLHLVACQTGDDADRFRALGLPEETVAVTGNSKFDLQLDDGQRRSAARWRAQLGLSERCVLVAGSTHPREEEQVLVALRRLRSDIGSVSLILAPRHPERAAELQAMCEADGWQWHALSNPNPPAPDCDVIIVDVMGELPVLYGLADVAFVGGSLVPRGGQNILEPARWGVPVVAGAHVENFRHAAHVLEEAGLLQRVTGGESIAQAVSIALKGVCGGLSSEQAARDVFAQHSGATKRMLKALAPLLESS